MSDEISSTNESLPPYEPEPRGEARIPGIDPNAIDKRLAECSEYFLKHCDETDYRNLEWYLWRMQLRFAVGDDIFEVVDDAFLAARCLHDRHAMHLELKPPEMFATRRIIPVELGILSGMPMLTLEFSATYGLPLMMVIGKTAPEDITGEANLMTSCFRRGFCPDYYELVGLAAVTYAGVIAAIGRGFDDEAIVGLNNYATARDSLRGMPPKSILPKLKRYDALNTALACLCRGDFDAIGGLLAPVADAFVEEQARKAGDEWLHPTKMPQHKYFDTAILTILALAALRQQIIELPNTGAIAAYRDFLRGLTEMPERRIEMPALDEESRRILREAGIDPENIGVDDSFQNEKEASEARAAALFEERQKRAQEAVRAKIAAGIAEEEAHTSIEPEKMGPEKLRLSDDDSGEDTGDKKRDFSNFFDNDDQNDDAARRAFDESAESAPKEEKDYGAFFDGDDTPRPQEDDDADAHKETKDFSAFFSEDNREDALLRENVETENAPVSDAHVESKDYSSFFSGDDHASEDDETIRARLEAESAQAEDSGKNYNSFFDNLDENAIPKFDDGSEDDAREVKTFTSDFFSSEAKLPSGLKMEVDKDPEPEPEPEPEPAKPTVPDVSSVPEVEDNSPRRDFTKFFDEAPKLAAELKMSDDAEENAKIIEKVQTAASPALDKTEEMDVVEIDEHEETAPTRDFTKFFDEAPKLAAELKMSDDDEENAKIIEKVQTAASPALDKTEEMDIVEIDEHEEAAPARDFTKFFDEAPKVAAELKMSDDAEENAKIVENAQVATVSEPEKARESDEAHEETAPARDFTKFFEEAPKLAAELKMSDDAEENAKIVETAQVAAVPQIEIEPETATEEEETEEPVSRDFGSFFDGDDREEHHEVDREAELRELEAEQKRKLEAAAQAQALKLELDGSEEPEIKATESYQERMARLMAEKHAAAREQALREREEAERELEEMRKTGVAKPVVEQLQLKPTESTDPDEKVGKVGPEDLVIKGFAFDALDRIHANTAETQEVEEDFDMHAAMAQKKFEEAQKSDDGQKDAISHGNENNQDDDILNWSN